MLEKSHKYNLLVQPHASAFAHLFQKQLNTVLHIYCTLAIKPPVQKLFPNESKRFLYSRDMYPKDCADVPLIRVHSLGRCPLVIRHKASLFWFISQGHQVRRHYSFSGDLITKICSLCKLILPTLCGLYMLKVSE